MAETFHSLGSGVTVSNRRFEALISWLLEVAERRADNAMSRASVAKLVELKESSFHGAGLWMDKTWPELDEVVFWAESFEAVADGIFRRELGNQELFDWQTSAICDATCVAELLRERERAMRRAGPAD